MRHAGVADAALRGPQCFLLAAAVVESLDNIYRRLEGTILLAVKAPLPRERKREILEQAALYTMQCDDPGGRALWLECAADALLDLRYDERARALLAEAQALAATLPVAGSAGSARRHVAEVLARIDLPATLTLVSNLAEDSSRDDVFGRIAYPGESGCDKRIEPVRRHYVGCDVRDRSAVGSRFRRQAIARRRAVRLSS